MNPNELPQDIQVAARALADAALMEPPAKDYRSAVAAFEGDLRASGLKKRFMDLYAGLIARQQKGEALSRKDTEPFYDLRREYYAHPLVIARDDALGALKPILANAADQISAQLGLDFTELSRTE